MQKIAADKMNILERDPESTLVTSKFFSEILLSTLLRTDHRTLRKICGPEAFIQNYPQRCSRKYRNSECYKFFLFRLRYLVTSNFVV